MNLCLYTDSVASLDFEDALGVAVDVGATAVEIAAGGQSAAPHMNVFDLIADQAARDSYAKKITERGLRLAAVNCSAWPMHPRHGAHHLRIIKAAIQLANHLEVDKIVTMSGCPGETPAARTINWVMFPWPDDLVEILAEQWEQALCFWSDLADYAQSYGISRIALELHPLHLVYNTPTLLRLRAAIGPIIGANVDPSHMFWQQMDPVAVIHALGPAVHHVHLKDVENHPEQLALTGVLDTTPFDDPDRRAWTFRTIGQGHDAAFWSSFVEALRQVGYDDVLSIENEDPYQPQQAGVVEAAAFITDLMRPASREARV